MVSRNYTLKTLFCLFALSYNFSVAAQSIEVNRKNSSIDEREVLKNDVLKLYWREDDYREICTAFLSDLSFENQKKNIQLITAYHCSLHQHVSKGTFNVYSGGANNSYEYIPSKFDSLTKITFPDNLTYRWHDIMFAPADNNLFSKNKVYNITSESLKINDSLTLIGYSKEVGGPYSLSCRYHGKTLQYARQMEIPSKCHSNSFAEFKDCKFTGESNRVQNASIDPHEMQSTNLPDSIYEVMLCDQKITEIIDDDVYKGQKIIQGIRTMSALGGMSGGPILTANHEVAGVFHAGLGLLDIGGSPKLILLFKPLNKKMLSHDPMAPLMNLVETNLSIDNLMLIFNAKVLSNATTRLQLNPEGFLMNDYTVSHPLLKTNLRFNKKSELISE